MDRRSFLVKCIGTLVGCSLAPFISEDKVIGWWSVYGGDRWNRAYMEELKHFSPTSIEMAYEFPVVFTHRDFVFPVRVPPVYPYRLDAMWMCDREQRKVDLWLN